MVQKAGIGFDGLLYEAGLSHRTGHKLSIHLDIDINPPAGWAGEKTIVDVHMPVVLQHYDLSSMYAGKLHAVLMRQYLKGRDLYDLFWYRTRQKELLPNFTLLNNAIAQGGEEFTPVTEDNWFEILAERVRGLDWKTVENDVLPFLEFRDDLETFTHENLLKCLGAG